jgi:hypothetical protein
MRPLRYSMAGVVTIVSLVPNVVLGKKPANTAAMLLSEGRRLMASGDYAEACPKLADSESQSPSGITALTLAICYEKAGKLATAVTAYKAAASVALASHQKKPAAVASLSAAKLEPTLSRVTVNLPPDASDIEVRLDGDIISSAQVGSPVAQDGGGHDLEVSAAGKRTWKKHFELAESGQTLSIDVPALRSRQPPPQEPSPAPETPKPASPSSGSPLRWVGIGAGAAGVVALGVGTFAGIKANSTYHDALTACNNGTACAPGSDGLSLRQSAGTWATLSTATFIAGGALLAGGVVLYLVAPRGDSGASSTVGLAPMGTGLSLVGSF